MQLRGVYLSAALRCAPPKNRPTAEALQQCHGYLREEMQALSAVRVILALGQVAWRAARRLLHEAGIALPSPAPTFAHGAEQRLDRVTLLGSYHVSQQNTFTGRLTGAMFDSILARANALRPTGTLC